MINEEDVVSAQDPSKAGSDLTDALRPNSRSALILNDMVVEGTRHITFMIARQFRQLIQTKLMVREGRKNEKTFFKLPFIAGNNQAGRRFDMDSLRRAVETGLELDLAVKNGRLKDRAAVELLITSLSTK